MPPKNLDFNIESLHLYDAATHKEIMTITEGADLELNVESNDYCYGNPIIGLFDCKEIELTLTNIKINTNSLHKILGADISSSPDSSNLQFYCLVQARKHRKKRINKKWLKRYGYKVLILTREEN